MTKTRNSFEQELRVSVCGFWHNADFVKIACIVSKKVVILVWFGNN